ncbi:possible membrane protein; possible peptidase, M23/M37 family [Cytophaga hutchinsonii ATCC 33406]|uniref:Possible membrane protein possible peptidase, M23/M37 family n=2 Tax=Cytophaga hutchinsonii TaxID=985 RepID=A0A6N4SM32_CYTH3|nr:possible membrane protein; possible peptidase, M23/M37 family [Cytophaga hutchinsonii ATCC 33406]SFX46237.1 Septal ring factor EnvC, activator of murein hydrolases AmiA and AmiB [Cytophaga hutchinsonii ATCC 33406]
MFQKNSMKNKLKYIAVVGLLFIVITSTLAQKKSRKELEKERERNLKKIKETTKVLEETKQQKNATLSQLTLLNQEIEEREVVINSMSTEVSLLEREIKEQEMIIRALEEDIKGLKEEYAQLIYLGYKHLNGYDKLIHILSADNIAQMLRRNSYFKQYAHARTYQLEEIESVAKALKTYERMLAGKQEEKTGLLQAKTIETKNLTNTKNQQSTVLRQLSSKEKELKKDLDESQKSVDKLQKLITDLIAAERKKALDKAKSSSSTANKATIEKNVKLSSNFEGNMGQLPWPVQNGRVSNHFGRQAHPVLKGVFVDNLGVDILTVQNEQVKAVFGGKVITVAEVPGMHKIVMVQHGEYFTVYAKLRDVSVSTGEEITVKQVIGSVYTGKDGESELQFQIWKNETKLNPEIWLRKR